MSKYYFTGPKHKLKKLNLFSILNFYRKLELLALILLIDRMAKNRVEFGTKLNTKHFKLIQLRLSA